MIFSVKNHLFIRLKQRQKFNDLFFFLKPFEIIFTSIKNLDFILSNYIFFSVFLYLHESRF